MRHQTTLNRSLYSKLELFFDAYRDYNKKNLSSSALFLPWSLYLEWFRQAREKFYKKRDRIIYYLELLIKKVKSVHGRQYVLTGIFILIS